MKVDAILCADLHIRATAPRCRTDNYVDTQYNKLRFIVELARKHNCPVLVAGDLGENAQWPNWLIEWFMRTIYGTTFMVIPGQHDLPNHKFELYRKSAIGVLSTSNSINLLRNGVNRWHNLFIHAFPYGRLITGSQVSKPKGKFFVAVAHQMVIKRKPLWPGQVAPKAHALLHKYPEYDLILTGDNHNPFTYKMDGRWLVNPGSMTRHKADQIKHKPRVYLWYAKSRHIERIYLPIENNVIDRTHIDVIKIKKERMQDFTDKLSNEVDYTNSFKLNVKKQLRESKVRPLTKKKIKAAVGGTHE